MSFKTFVNLNSYNSDFLLLQTIAIPNYCHFEYTYHHLTTFQTGRPRKLAAKGGHTCEL